MNATNPSVIVLDEIPVDIKHEIILRGAHRHILGNELLANSCFGKDLATPLPQYCREQRQRKRKDPTSSKIIDTSYHRKVIVSMKLYGMIFYREQNRQ